MNKTSIDLVTNTFGLIKDGEGLVTDFYAELFNRYPETESFFAQTDMTVQRKKLLHSLNLVVQNLRHPNILKKSLAQLGERHAQNYGTLNEHYPLVGEALLAALAKHLDDNWNDDVAAAWTAAYEALVDMMTHPESVTN